MLIWGRKPLQTAPPLAWTLRRICCSCEHVWAENLLLPCSCVKGRKSGPNSLEFPQKSCIKMAEMSPYVLLQPPQFKNESVAKSLVCVSRVPASLLGRAGTRSTETWTLPHCVKCKIYTLSLYFKYFSYPSMCDLLCNCRGWTSVVVVKVSSLLGLHLFVCCTTFGRVLTIVMTGELFYWATGADFDFLVSAGICKMSTCS